MAKLLGISVERTVKAIALMANEKFYLALLRGDHNLNEVKIVKVDGWQILDSRLRRKFVPISIARLVLLGQLEWVKT